MTSPAARNTHLAKAYHRYLASANSTVFATEVNDFYSRGTLASILQRSSVPLRRAAALALGILGDATSIEPLGRAMSDRDRGVRMAADDSFRALIVRSAAPAHHQQLLRVMHLTDGGSYAEALAPTMVLVGHAPKYAEAYHQMAVCWQGMENFTQAESAYTSCLWLCRFHYPAWQGLARCRMMMNNYVGAINALDNCIQICPDVESARLQRRALRRRMRQSDV